jgi:hypothetical protein
VSHHSAAKGKRKGGEWIGGGGGHLFDDHVHAIALHFMHYNFARIHQTLRITPAMAAGVSMKVWSIADIVMLSD